MNDITYFIGMDIVRRICPKMNGTEMAKPQASDAVLRHICAVTDKIYRRGGNSCCVCVLAAKDFIILRTSYCALVACSGR